MNVVMSFLGKKSIGSTSSSSLPVPNREKEKDDNQYKVEPLLSLPPDCIKCLKSAKIGANEAQEYFDVLIAVLLFEYKKRPDLRLLLDEILKKRRREHKEAKRAAKREAKEKKREKRREMKEWEKVTEAVMTAAKEATVALEFNDADSQENGEKIAGERSPCVEKKHISKSTLANTFPQDITITKNGEAMTKKKKKTKDATDTKESKKGSKRGSKKGSKKEEKEDDGQKNSEETSKQDTTEDSLEEIIRKQLSGIAIGDMSKELIEQDKKKKVSLPNDVKEETSSSSDQANNYKTLDITMKRKEKSHLSNSIPTPRRKTFNLFSKDKKNPAFKVDFSPEMSECAMPTSKDSNFRPLNRTRSQSNKEAPGRDNIGSTSGSTEFVKSDDPLEPKLSGRRAKVELTLVPITEELLIAADPTKLYNSKNKIGHGGFGDVFTAKDLKRGGVVAIKILKKPFPGNEAMIQNEIAILKSCAHPNIVNYVESYLYHNKVWVVMEYCDGGTLHQLLSEVVLTDPQIAFICKQILSGLAYLHKQNRIHRDIKSDNVLLNINGNVKLADLGLCAEVKEDDQKKLAVVGSRYWMAPEMIRREAYTSKVDIWSLASLCYEMVEGAPPYWQYKSLKAMFRVATRGAPPLRHPEKRTDLFLSFLKRCTEFNPNNRASAEELLSDPFLEKACEKAKLAQSIEIVFLGNSLRMNGF